MYPDTLKLINEAYFFHLQIFKRAPSQKFIDQYLRVHSESVMLFRATAQELNTISIIIHKQLDAVAIEPWLRGGSHRHLLSRKLLLVAYLGECDGEHLDFRQVANGWLRSVFCLCGSALLSSKLIVKGWLQKVIYDLI
jgi:hypothetical protein